MDDTIVAIASAPGGALRGIVRVSGADCVSIVERVFFTMPTASRQASCTAGEIRLPPPLGVVSAKLLLWPTNRSYTRQPTAELHTLGSPPILAALVAAINRAGARLARPGEFTLRAFLAGRIDLPQAEAVLGVIDAHDAAALRSALGQLAGNLSRPLAELHNNLLDLLAHLEAGLDFVDEDIEFISPAELESRLAAGLGLVEQIEARMESRSEAVELPRVVLVGPPNAGKSSLFNALSAADAALVSSQPGTTRDYLSRVVRLAGQECLLIDTAGLEEELPSDAIQAAAQGFSRELREQADVVLMCAEARSAAPLAALDRSILQVLTKCDLGDFSAPPNVLLTSARTGFGLAELGSAIAAAINARRAGDIVPATAARCRASLLGAANALRQAREALAEGAGEELIAAELRLAIDELGQVLGAVYTDDILDRIFSRFCIGK